MPSTLGFHPKPWPTLLPLMQKSRQKKSSPCILADLPRLATGTKRTRLRLKQLFVLSCASPGRYPAADAMDKAAFGMLLYSKIFAKLKTALLLAFNSELFTDYYQLITSPRLMNTVHCSPITDNWSLFIDHYSLFSDNCSLKPAEAKQH